MKLINRIKKNKLQLNRIKDNRSQIAISTTSHMVTDLYASFVIGLIPVLADKFNLTLFMVGLLTSVNQITNSFTQPLFGYFSDKYGGKYFLVSGPLFASIFISFLGIAPNYYIILILLFLGNLSVAALHPPSAAMASYFGGKRKGFGNSIISFGGSLGYSTGSLFIIYVVEKLGMNFTPITMIPGIIMAIILIKLIPDTLMVKTQKSNIKFISKLKKIKKIRLFQLFVIWIASYSRDLLWITLMAFMPLYFTKADIKLINIGYILLALGLLGGIGGLFSGYYSDRIKNKSYIIQVGLICSVPLIYFVFKTTGMLSIILFILGGFFFISTLPLTTRLSQDIFPSNISLASSLVIGFSQGSAAITLIFLGKLADSIGIVKTINFLLILPLFSFLLLFIFPSLDKD